MQCSLFTCLRVLFFWGDFAESCFFSFLGGAWRRKKKNNNNETSGGQRGWDLGFPASHRHHSGQEERIPKPAIVVGKKSVAVEW